MKYLKNFWNLCVWLVIKYEIYSYIRSYFNERENKERKKLCIIIEWIDTSDRRPEFEIHLFNFLISDTGNLKAHN